MIPVELTIEGLYSYQRRQTIDFRNLTGAGLFGIFGSVGSGKSSILEAITYAIYGKTDKLNISGDNRYYNMMNLKSNELFIDFVFETGKDQTAYRAIVRGKRNSKRFEEVKTLDHTAYRKVDNEWVPIEVGELENVIGLNYVNFKRTIIIPQGQFQEFLQLGNKDRTTMMKELFNLQKFEFYYKVVSLDNKNNDKKNNINGQLQQLGAIDPEQVNIFGQQLLDLDKNIKELNIKIAGLQKEEEKLRSFKELIIKRDEAGELLNNLVKQEPEFAHLKNNIERYELCVMSFKHLLDSLKDYRYKVQLRSNQIESDNKNLSSHNEIIEKLEKSLEELRPKYDKREELKRKADELDTALKIKKLDASVIEITSRVEKGTEYWNNTNLIVADLKKEREKLEGDLGELRKNMPDVTLLTKIRTWYNEKNSIERQISEINRDLEKYTRKENELISQKNTLLKEPILQGGITVDRSFDECYQFLEISASNIKKRQSELNEHESHVLVKARLEAYAENLQDNTPCPLCGSLHHPEIFKSEDIKELLEDIKKEKLVIEEELLAISSISRQMSLIEVSHKETVNHIVELKASKESLLNNLSDHSKLFTWDKFKQMEELDIAFSEMEQIQNRIKSCESALQEKVKELNKQENILELARVKLEGLKNTLTINKTELNTLVNQLRIINFGDYKELTNSAIYDERTKLINDYERIENTYIRDNKQLQEEKKNRDILKGRLETNVSELGKEQSAIENLERKIDSELAKSDFKSIEEVKSILSESINIQQEKKRVEEFNNNLLKCRSAFEQLHKEVGERTYNKEIHDKLISEIKLHSKQLATLNNKQVEITLNLRSLQKNLDTQAVLRKELEEVELRAENLKTMKSLFKASGFVNYISSVYLQNLCNAANDRFFQLTRQKLSLEITPDNNFQIRDFMNGGKERSVKTLSGGQTFQASLSLALALADNIQKITHSNQNFFFLDEGFGSLDKESLSVVFDTLKTLRKENRIVGVISHVEEMQQEIEVHLRIENDSDRGSIAYYSWEE
ncbi:MAG: SMC family ATPase [Fermentimonas sp.]|nr:SMC family ATPase [Fermentimonas sp.]